MGALFFGLYFSMASRGASWALAWPSQNMVFRCKNEVLALQGGSLLRGLNSYANKHHVRSFLIAKENHSNSMQKCGFSGTRVSVFSGEFIHRCVSWLKVPMTRFAR